MFLDKYIAEKGPTTDYDIFANNISIDVVIPTNDLFLAQYTNQGFNAMDIIVKLLAIENYYGMNDYGFSLYNKMQKKRVGENWEKRFKDLIKSVEENGLMNIKSIDTDINYSIHDGAHRLALAIFHNVKDLNVKVFNTSLLRRNYGIEWFYENGFDLVEIAIIMNKFNEVKERLNDPYYSIFWPPARNIFEKLEEELPKVEEGISVVDKEIIKLPRDTFKIFMYDVYNTDDIAKYKLDLKYQYLMNSLNKDSFKDDTLPFVVVRTKLDNPDFKMKALTGLPQSKATMRIKKQIRNDNSSLITDYYYDIIMHMTDNTIQNDDVKKILTRVKK